jgi:predicted DNA-binding transcriptional regulator YafY
MASKRVPASSGQPGQVSATRSARLYRLIALFRNGPKTRDQLARALRLDMRGFYRDLKMLRELGVRIDSRGHRYLLGQSFERAISRLPFPDPRLSLHDAIQLAEGRTAAHQKLRKQIQKITARR